MTTLINPRTQSQCQSIIDWLEAGNTITQADAAERFGCWRLAARISDLKEYGWKINKTMERRNGKRYARYYLEH